MVSKRYSSRGPVGDNSHVVGVETEKMAHFPQRSGEVISSRQLTSGLPDQLLTSRVFTSGPCCGSHGGPPSFTPWWKLTR